LDLITIKILSGLFRFDGKSYSTFKLGSIALTTLNQKNNYRKVQIIEYIN